MSKTACWGTGKLVDCAWISFGYGSCYDTSRFWISLEAAKALARLDFPGPSTSFWEGTIEELKALPPRLRMRNSAWHVHVPDDEQKSIEWWVEIEKEIGMADIKNITYRNVRESFKEMASQFPEEWAIKESCYEKTRIAQECQYGYTSVFWPIKSSPPEGMTAFHMAWYGKHEEMDEFSKNPQDSEDGPSIYEVLTEEVMKSPQQKLDEQKKHEEANREWREQSGIEIIQSGNEAEDYYSAIMDDTVLCKRHEYGMSYVYIPKDYYVFGARHFGSYVDGQYHEYRGYVSPPEDWFKFGGLLKIRRMSGTGGSRNPRCLDKEQTRRNYQSQPHEWYIFGGPTICNDSRTNHEDLWNNPKIP